MRQKRSRQHDPKCRLKSIYFNHPSQDNSTTLSFWIQETRLRLPQVNKFPPKRVKNPEASSSIFIFISSSSTGELCSQPIRGSDRPVGRMFPEHDDRRFLDPEYSFDEYFQLGSRRNIRPIKNGFNVHRNKTELFFYSGRTRLVFTCVFGRYVASTVVSRSEGADGVGGQLRGDKRVPLQWRNQI